MSFSSHRIPDKSILENIAFKYSPIEKNFYQNMRTEITLNNLRLIEKKIQTLKEPSIFGTYLNDSHYFETLQLMLSSTNETRHRGFFFLKKILPMLNKTENLLDIGCGDGKLTKWLGNKFKQVTIIEKNKTALENLNAANKILRKHIILNKVCDSIVNIKLQKNHYDLGILSHLLYYIDKNHWVDIIKKTYDAITPGGIIAIAMSGDNLGKADLIKNFGGEPPDIDKLAETCALNFGEKKIQGYFYNEVFFALSLQTMLHIAGFMLCDAGISVEKDALVPYIDKNLRINDKLFQITSRQKYILIFK